MPGLPVLVPHRPERRTSAIAARNPKHDCTSARWDSCDCGPPEAILAEGLDAMQKVKIFAEYRHVYGPNQTHGLGQASVPRGFCRAGAHAERVVPMSTRLNEVCL